MPREHADIKMTPEELRDFLQSHNRLVVASLDADGGGWVDAAAFTFVQDRVYFRLPVDTRSFRNIQRDNRVCCVIESKPATASYYDIKGAMLHGAADAVTGQAVPAAVRATLDAIADPVTPDEPGDGKIFSIGLDDHTSFVFAKIKYRYQDRALKSIQADAGLV
jgi:nitroimidazol reductase NimA-like FMN-containing flavoprotein (pyridoxamine 5'-phosphate oxidase superfamily)